MTLSPRNDTELLQEEAVKDRADKARDLRIATVSHILNAQLNFRPESPVYQTTKNGLLKLSQRELNALQAMVCGG